jgi:hypothetical protein
LWGQRSRRCLHASKVVATAWCASGHDQHLNSTKAALQQRHRQHHTHPR